MSHTTAIRGISITNITALERAIEELNEKGIKCSLVPDSTPRAYYPNQAGLGHADYIIQLAGSPYDIGLYKQENGSFEPRCDFWEHVRDGKSISALLGGKATTPENNDQAKLGQLFQLYGVHAAMQQARMQGHTVQRKNNEETGKIQLILTGGY